MLKKVIMLITIFAVTSPCTSVAEDIDYLQQFNRVIADAQSNVDGSPKEAAYGFLNALNSLGKAFANEQVTVDESNRGIIKAVLESAPSFAKKLYPQLPTEDYEKSKVAQYIIIASMGSLDNDGFLNLQRKIESVDKQYNDDPWLLMQGYFVLYQNENIGSHNKNMFANKIRQYGRTIDSIENIYKAYFYIQSIVEIYSDSDYSTTDPLVKNFINSTSLNNSLIRFEEGMIAAIKLKYDGMVAEQNRLSNETTLSLNKSLSGDRGNIGYEYVYQTNDGRQVSVFVKENLISVYGSGSYTTTEDQMSPELAAKKALGMP